MGKIELIMLFILICIFGAFIAAIIDYENKRKTTKK